MEKRLFLRDIVGDLLIACLIAGVMTLAWAWRDWANLSVLHLPDTDDVMRLQQIRDWLGGQAFVDLTQHRLGPEPGLAMHWSRLADLAPAALITWLTPALGRHGAEVAAVIIWPALLFAAALALVASLARRVDPHGQARTAIIVAAIGYPATTLFLPGRIDHHGLQIVLLLVLARALVARPSLGAGIVAALASAASLIIGLETAPLLVIGAAALAIGWCRDPAANERALLGYGLALGLALGFGALVFGGSGWLYPACDGFTAIAWRVGMAGAASMIALALIGPGLGTVPARLAAIAGIGALVLLIDYPALRVCASPYSSVDPLLARVWLGNVGEAQPLFAADPATAIGYSGLMIAGIVASLLRWWRTARRGWLILLALQIGALLLTLVQLRGAYAGAILAAPGLAMLIAAARRAGAGWLAAAWIASAGMLYPIAAQAVNRQPAAPQGAATTGCATPAAIEALAALRSGLVIAPIDFGAYAIAGTPHRLLAAPYHRNNAGNRAMIDFFAASPDTAHTLATRIGARYVVACAGAVPGAFADRLTRRGPPGWLTPVTRITDGPTIYAIH